MDAPCDSLRSCFKAAFSSATFWMASGVKDWALTRAWNSSTRSLWSP